MNSKNNRHIIKCAKVGKGISELTRNDDICGLGISWEVREFIRAIEAHLRRTQGGMVSITSRKLVQALGHSPCERAGAWLRYKFARFLRCLERRRVVSRVGRSTGFVYVVERGRLERVLEDRLQLAMLIEGDMA